MGTSISQPSPRTTNWKPVHAGYQNKFIPESRIINEIWRASENEQLPLSKDLKSEAIFDCYAAVKSSKTFEQAIQKFNTSLIENKSSSIIAEFAKKAIPGAFQSAQPASNWASRFFAEVTNYIISRDTSGFVGDKCRNKTVSELVNFKKNIHTTVSTVISKEIQTIKNKNEWNSFVDKSINKLKSNSGQ
jgi:hypothetical protein